MSTSGLVNNSIRIAVTPGEPAGIGPDILLQYAQQELPFGLIAIADATLLQSRAAQLRLSVELHDFEPDRYLPSLPARHLYVWHTPMNTSAQPGVLNPANADYVLRCLRRAAEACLYRRCDAMVTGPVHKAIINEAGIPFSGHTEFLAELAGVNTVVMMLATAGLRVALATTHVPLSRVSESITTAHLETVITILRDELRTRFNLPRPRISVCGLNPHAGEDGHLGREEIDVLIPVLERLRQQDFILRGPLPADTAFIPAVLHDTDAYLAMYHDQGLPVLKYAGFGNAVNITLGLPFIRTSVDHGTALELAGTGRADPASLSYAVETARQMADSMQPQLRPA